MARWNEEFDFYMCRVVPLGKYGHCRFKKGGEPSSTTTRNIPEQTANEKGLENFLLDSASLGGNMAPYAYQAFAGSLNDVMSPNFSNVFNDYLMPRTDENVDKYTSYLQDTLSDYSSKVNDYSGKMESALGNYNKSMNGALSAYNQANAKRSPLWDDLVNGILPSQYAANRQAALNADLKGTVGSAINGLASRGVINSGVGNKALDDISQSASDTLAKRYADDLALEASLLGQDRANYRDAYDVAANTASGKYSTASNTYNNVMDNYSKLYTTQLGTADKWLSAANGANNDLWDALISGQNASLQVPSTYLSYASQLSNPVENLYNTMYSGRMGTGSTTTTQSDGGAGALGAIGSLGAAFIMCFTGDTLITTPDGYKAIRDIEVGDEVLSVQNGEIVTKKVKSLSMPHEMPIVNVYFDNGTVWHTTAGQRYFDGKHFCYCDGGDNPALVLNGKPSAIRCVAETDARELVYDFTVEGFAGENVFFANDVAAEGLGD